MKNGAKDTKFQRHSLILKLIEESPVETQKDLSDLLCAAGYDVTQATVSRDIKELRLVKSLSPDGHYRYTTASSESGDFTARFHNIFRESVVNVDAAGNIIVIKTLPGVANAATAAIDTMDISHIVGSLAGDDTIFLVIRDEKHAASLCQEIRDMLK